MEEKQFSCLVKNPTLPNKAFNNNLNRNQVTHNSAQFTS